MDDPRKEKVSPTDLPPGVRTGRIDVRLASGVIDLFVAIAFTLAMLFFSVLPYFIYMEITTNGDYPNLELEGNWLFFVIAAIYLLYFVLGWWLFRGQTFGKWIMGLQVVSRRDLEPPRWQNALVRAVGYLANWVFIPLWAVPILNDERRGVQDLFARTVVVHKDSLPAVEDVYKAKRGEL